MLYARLTMLSRWLLLFLVIGGDVGGGSGGGMIQMVAAEKRIEIDVDTTLDPSGNSGNPLISPPIVGNIHGAGFLSFANLQADRDPTTSDNAVSILSIDAAIFSLKEKPRTENELSKLMEETIGAYGTDGNLYTCCTETASEFGACDYNYLGFLIVQKNVEGVGFKNSNIVTVEHRKMDIFVGGENGEFNFGAMAIDFVDQSEHMVLVFADCDDPNSGSVRIHGKVIWVSYVSGITVPLYLVLACFHVLLAIWYKRLMNINIESRIQLEVWILYTIVLAAGAVSLETLLFATEVYAENELLLLKLLSDFLRSIAAAVSRCLYLTLALGLGVITSSLSRITTSLLGLCLGLYVLGMCSVDLVDVTAPGTIIEGFAQVVFWLDMLFLIWIPCALLSTMKYLKLNGEHMKLARYKWILRIYFLAIALTILQVILFFNDMINRGGRNFDLMSIREGNEVIHLVVLICISYLWRPNPSQQQYAYVLLDEDGQTPSLDNMNGITDLELTEVAKEEEDLAQQTSENLFVI